MEMLHGWLKVIIGGIISGLIVGVILFNLYEDDPRLSVSCEFKSKDIITINIENTGEPALDVMSVVTAEGKTNIHINPKQFNKIGKEPLTIEFPLNIYRKNFKNESLRVYIDCVNCDRKKITYSNNCYNFK